MNRIKNTNLLEEVTRIRWAALRSLVVCTIATVLGYSILSRVFEFPTELPERIAFAFKANLFVLLWVLVAVGMVSRGRRQRVEDIWGSAFGPPSPSLSIKVAFLQNTLEQAVMAICVHLVLAVMISGPNLSLIIVSVFLFGLGRIFFYRGYSSGAGGRAFGMVTTALPILFGFVVAVSITLLKFF